MHYAKYLCNFQSQPRQENRFSTFSPTLAQLLTAPEKNTPGNVGRSVNSISTANNYVQQKVYRFFLIIIILITFIDYNHTN